NKRSIELITKNTLEITDETKTILSNNKDNINQSIENASIAIVKTDSLLSTLNSLLAETRNKQNNLGQVLYDENLIKDLDKTLKNLKELTDIALEQMHKNGLKVETKIKLF
ncbi:MAG TPA: ABC transporter substrate-binding protein, partial [Ignavibacteriaceae bacterium]|nr:ABC transporter substrate-binding protein [Ignavibacteriaceae bacterium]